MNKIDNVINYHPKAFIIAGATLATTSAILGSLALKSVVVLTGAAAAATGWGLIALALILGIGLIARGYHHFKNELVNKQIEPLETSIPPIEDKSSRPSLEELVHFAKNPASFKGGLFFAEYSTLVLFDAVLNSKRPHVETIIEVLREKTPSNVYAILQKALPLATDEQVKALLQRELDAEIQAERTSPYSSSDVEGMTHEEYSQQSEAEFNEIRPFLSSAVRTEFRLLKAAQGSDLEALKRAVERLRTITPHNVHHLLNTSLSVAKHPNILNYLELELANETKAGKTGLYIPNSPLEAKREYLSYKLDKYLASQQGSKWDYKPFLKGCLHGTAAAIAILAAGYFLSPYAAQMYREYQQNSYLVKCVDCLHRMGAHLAKEGPALSVSLFTDFCKFKTVSGRPPFSDPLDTCRY